jgi:hypothetical protein
MRHNGQQLVPNVISFKRISLTSSKKKEANDVSNDEYFGEPLWSNDCVLLPANKYNDSAEYHIDGRCE